jgi:hypothetical protein
MASVVSAVAWPDALKRDKSLTWTPDRMNQFGPSTISGVRPVSNINGGGLWRARFADVVITSTALALAWQAMELIAEDGLVPIDVPVLLCDQIPKHADGAATVISAVGDVASRAVSLRVDLEHAGTLLAGMQFSDYDATTYGNRLHRIKTVAAVGGHASWRDITIWPPLRFAMTDNHVLNFDAPKCVMTLAESNVMELTLEQRKRGYPAASFAECGDIL